MAETHRPGGKTLYTELFAARVRLRRTARGKNFDEKGRTLTPFASGEPLAALADIPLTAQPSKAFPSITTGPRRYYTAQ
jgi:hypothetical protein